MAPLPELSAISKTLNDKSNRVNLLLKVFEGKLCAMNPGVEAWVTLTEQRTLEKYEGSVQLDEPKFRSTDEQLGFAQRGARWALLVRTTIFEKSSVNEDADWVVLNIGPTTALLQAPRETRIAALTKLDALVSELTAEATRTVQSITAAEQMIDNL